MVVSAWDELAFTRVIDDMVAESAPRTFAVVQVFGERLDARIAAWGLAWDGQAEIVGVDGDLRIGVRSPERACRLLAQPHDVSARLVWLPSGKESR